MSVKDARIEWVRDLAVSCWAKRSDLDLTRKSLSILWGKVFHSVNRVSPAPLSISENELTPEWFVLQYEMLTSREKTEDGKPQSGYDLTSIWLMDGLAYYFGEVFVREFSHISWQLIVSSRYEMSCMPHVVSSEWRNFRFCTWQQVATNFVRVWHSDFSVDMDGFNRAYEGMIELGKWR
jgi:hypothetical protein